LDLLELGGHAGTCSGQRGLVARAVVACSRGADLLEQCVVCRHAIAIEYELAVARAFGAAFARLRRGMLAHDRIFSHALCIHGARRTWGQARMVTRRGRRQRAWGRACGLASGGRFCRAAAARGCEHGCDQHGGCEHRAHHGVAAAAPAAREK
jgi:hypothetical protein